MPSANRIAEIKQVDAFLARKKFLQGPIPTWVPSTRVGEVQMIWNLVDEDGITNGHLRFRAGKEHRACPSISVIFRGDNSVWRLDIEDPSVCHDNPPDADQLGLPATVCGSHAHTWNDNCAYILNEHGWTIPYRRPIPPQVRRLEQALPWLADQINLELGPDQRDVQLPELDLFGEIKK